MILKIETLGVLLALLAALPACGDDDDAAATIDAGNPADGGPDGGEAPATYVLANIVSTSESQSALYVSLLDSLGPQEIDLGQAREFADGADVWTYGTDVFVADTQGGTITKFAIEDGALVQKAEIGFQGNGTTQVAFWNNKFVSAEKAYVISFSGLIVWNPKSMEIIKKVDFPEIAVPEGKFAYAGYTDRATVVRDGKLYQPIYITDNTYFSFGPSSYLVVVDVATDTVEEMLEIPCPGIDYASLDAQGTIYFSSWIFAPGGAAVLAQPATCVASLAAGASTVDKLFGVKQLFGHEGGVVKVLPDGRVLVSILHEDNVPEADREDVTKVAYGNNWKFYIYDLATHTPTEVSAIGFNSGALYAFDIDDRTYMLVPNNGYADTSIWEVAAGGVPVEQFNVTGWVLRLFRAE